MKRFLPMILILIVSMCAASWAANPAWYQTAWALFFTGSDGKARAVTSEDGLPVSPSRSGPLPSIRIVAGPTAASLTMPASAAACTIFNLGSGTIWADTNTGGATVGYGIPIGASQSYQQSFEARPGDVVWYVASQTTPGSTVEHTR